MFTGIIERALAVVSADASEAGRRIVLEDVWGDVVHGESIAVNGTCLTVADLCDGRVAFDVIVETLDKTNLGNLRPGDAVNIERSLRVGGRLDGHFVQGHVDGVGRFIGKVDNHHEWRYTIEAPPAVARYLSPKGSICLDGVSLTIAALDGPRFDVALIPTTLNLTTLAGRQVGYRFNLEADLISKQIVTFLDARLPGMRV